MSRDEEFDAGPAGRKPKKSGPWTCLTLLLVGGSLSVIVLCCGGGAGLAWFGMNILATEIENELRDNEPLREHIGIIESFKLDFTRTAADRDSEAMVYRVKGSLGEGFVTVISETDADGNEIVRQATLRKSDGTEIPLVP